MSTKKVLVITGDNIEISDSHHTFDELYAHRCTLFAALMKCNKDLAWKSLFHSDGSNFEGWFLAGMNLPSGVVTYHLPIDQFWSRLGDVTTLQNGPEWDGHTSEDVIKRIIEWLE